MIAVIMAGGKGTRLKERTKDLIPKPMIPILGKPLLLWQVETLKRNGINRFIFVIGHLGHIIQDYFGDGTAFGIHIDYYIESTPLGSAGALADIRDSLGEDAFFLAFGDILFDIDLQRMVHFHEDRNADITLFSHPNSHPVDSDVLVLDSDGKLQSILKKNQPRNQWYRNCVNAGLYLVEPRILQGLPHQAKLDFEKDIILPILENGGSIFGYQSSEYVKDAGTPDRIDEVEAALKSGIVRAKNLSHLQKAIFLDRDGTVNQYRGLVYRPDQLELEEDAAAAISLINSSPYLAIVVTNQPSVARGLCEIEDIQEIHRKLETLLGLNGAYLDAILFCPHHPDKGYPEENPAYKIPCRCRKPDIGMIEECVSRYHIDLSSSWIIGDSSVDIQTGYNARLHTMLLTGTGMKGADGKYPAIPEQTCKSLLDAVSVIIQTSST